MTRVTKIALLGLMAVAFTDFATAAIAQEQEICLNRPMRSLTDNTTESEEFLQRVDAIGNRCVYSARTGERITRSQIESFLQANPDARDIVYGQGRVTTTAPGQ